jgi:hypothetical protein
MDACVEEESNVSAMDDAPQAMIVPPLMLM